MEAPNKLATPVAIIGGGPVGLVLALYLDFYGVKCTLFNREPQERWHPKGNGQNARTMEHYRQLGFSDEIRTLGLPDDHPFDQAYFTRLSFITSSSTGSIRARSCSRPMIPSIP